MLSISTFPRLNKKKDSVLISNQSKTYRKSVVSSSKSSLSPQSSLSMIMKLALSLTRRRRPTKKQKNWIKTAFYQNHRSASR